MKNRTKTPEELETLTELIVRHLGEDARSGIEVALGIKTQHGLSHEEKEFEGKLAAATSYSECERLWQNSDRGSYGELQALKEMLKRVATLEEYKDYYAAVSVSASIVNQSSYMRAYILKFAELLKKESV